MIQPHQLVRQAWGEDERQRWPALMLLLLDLLHSVAVELPIATEMALRTADLYWRRGEGTSDNLEAARVDCWALLKEIEKGMGLLGNPAARITRAVLCVLEPDGGTEEMSLSADWVADMLDGPPPLPRRSR